MAYYFEKNDSELSEELSSFLSLSYRSTVSCKHEYSNTNQNPQSKRRKAISTDKCSYIIKSYKQFKQFENCVFHEVSKFDLTNSNLKNNNDTKYSFSNVQKIGILSTAKRKKSVKKDYIFVNNNLRYSVKFIGLKDNSNVEKNEVTSLDDSAINEDKKKTKQVFSNRNLSSVVYSKISRGSRANNKAVVRAIKEKGPGGMDELFSNMKLKNTSKSILFEETLITPVFEGVIAQDSPKTTYSPNNDDSRTNNDIRQSSKSIFSKSSNKNEKAAAAAIKEKGAQGLNDLFADMNYKNPKLQQNRKSPVENDIFSDLTSDNKSPRKFTNKSLTSAVYSNMSKGVKGNDKAVISAIKQHGPNGLNEFFSNIKSRSTSKFNQPEENPIAPVFEGKLVSEPQKINNTVKSEPNSKFESENKRSMTQSVFSKTNNKNEKSPASKIKETGSKGVKDLFADMKQTTNYKKQLMAGGEIKPVNSDGKSIASSTASKSHENLIERGINEKGELFSKYPPHTDIFKHTVINEKRISPPVSSKRNIDHKQELNPTIKGKGQGEILDGMYGFHTKSTNPHEESAKANLFHSKVNTTPKQNQTLETSAIKNKEPMNSKNMILPQNSKLLHHEAPMPLINSIDDKKAHIVPKLKHTLSPNKNEEYDIYNEEPFKYSPKSTSPIHPYEPQKPFIDLKTGLNAQAGPIIEYLKFPCVKNEQVNKNVLNKTVSNATINTQSSPMNSKPNEKLTLFTRKTTSVSIDSEFSEISQFSFVEGSDISLGSEDEQMEKLIGNKNVITTVLNMLFQNFSSHKSRETLEFKFNSLRNNIEKRESKSSNKKRNFYETIKYGVFKMNDSNPKRNPMIQEASKTMGLVKPTTIKSHTLSPESKFKKHVYKYPTLENLEHPQTVIFREFDSNICEICSGFLNKTIEDKTRCLCDFKNSEQTMWRRHSLERMNDFSVRDKTMLISMFIPLSKGKTSVLLDLDNARITPEQKKKLKSLKKRKRKKTIYNLQHPQYLIHPFTIRRTESV